MQVDYDLIVIGGGVNGAGIARDAALRGIKTLLVEKKDFAYGATGACSGMIHGGVRYLLSDYKTTIKSCVDSGYIQKIVPHLLFRIPFLIPITNKALLEPMETYFSVYDKWAESRNGKKHTRLTVEEAKRVEPGITPNIFGAITMDEWGIDTFRLTLLNAISASQAGATVRNHCEVVGLLRNSNKDVVGVRIKDHRRGVYENITARIVMNACGPWGTKMASLADATVKIRPSKGVHLTLDRRISNVGIITDAIDGRQIFVIPHESTSIIGTTDDDYYGDLDDIPITEDEVEYLLQGIERVFPAVRNARILRAWAGIRPTIFGWHKNEDDLSRDHLVIDHANEGASGLMSITGGKLAAYRMMSEDAVDKVAEKLGVKTLCKTHEISLPGGDSTPDPSELASQFNISVLSARRLVFRHGSLAYKVLSLLEENPAWRKPVCRCEPVLEAEIRYVCRNEWVEDLNDIRRRTRMGMGPCQGARCAFQSALILADEKNENADTALAYLENFLQRRFKGKAPVLMDSMLAQEELNQGIYQCLGKVGDYIGRRKC